MSPVRRFIGRWSSVPAAGALMAGILLLAGLGIIFQNEDSYQDQKRNEAQVQADILAASVMAAMDFGDTAAAQESADALRANPQIEQVGIYDARGALFAGFERSGDEIARRFEPDAAEMPGTLSVAAPIAQDGRRVGTVHLTAAREPLSRRLTRYSIIALFVVMAALVVGILAAAQAALRRANRELEAQAGALTEANAELKIQMEERGKAEEQLRQAQKMQALGQLTGGIAHDFNNLLTVIQGSAEILQRPNLAEEKRARFAAAISQTAARAAALTSQLLAFARRQPLRPETLDLNEQIVGMVELLDRTLGERVLVRTELSTDVCTVKADPIQLEAAILNVAVNARDAMPDGGTLTLRTGPAPDRPEDEPAIALSISDTGGGIDPDTLARVFEPFFTTKSVGKGTGLGLSQVYGFATQSGGDVSIDSRQGYGTTVTLILPCSDGESQPAQKDSAAAPADAQTGRVLLVDDNEEVGTFAEALLGELGYDVVRAQSGDEALALFGDAGKGIDLAFTDVVMPGMSGLELADRLRALRPDLPIILTTGFSDRVSEGATDLPVLLKPYKIDTLAAALAKALAR